MNVRRQLMARKLAAASGRRLPTNRPSAPPKRGAGDREQVLRGLATSLKKTAEFTGGVDLGQRYVEQAKRQEESGDLVAAANSLRLAVALAPDRPDIVEHHDRLAGAVAIDLADTYEAQAKYEEENGKWADAALSWSKVCDGRSEVAEPHWKAAHCMLKATGDLQRAKTYAQRAADLEPQNPDAQRTLGLIFHAAGMKLNAKRTLELASELDPSDEMVENLLRELK